MAYEIGRYQKPKKNRKLIDNTTDLSSLPSTPSCCYGKLNENTGINSKKTLTADTHSRKIFHVEDKLSDIITKIRIRPILKRNVDSKYLL